ncbi:MAG: SH3 domain-containing protein [Patescibacteria group bacterium]
MQLIKNRFSLFLFLALLIGGVFLIGVNQAKAVGDAYFPQNTTVTLDLGDFTIIGVSDADTVTTNGTDSITVTISSGQSFTLESAGRRLLNNNGGFSYSCADDKSSLTITTTTTITVIITPSSTVCGSTSVGGTTSGGGGGGGAITLTPTPTSTPVSTPVPTSTPVSSPVSAPISTGLTPASRGFTNLSALSLKEGDVISAAGSSDPDVYIVNTWGYKRLFLNPVIFEFYGHLGGFNKVKTTLAPIRDTLVTSGLFRNCETNDEKVYGIETTGEDTGILHWVNTTGAQAVADDSNFFKKVFCINSKEFGWYKQGAPYSSVNQIPLYTRTTPASGSPVPVVLKKVKVISTVPWLNVRDGGSLSAKVIGQVLPNQEFDSSVFINGWYKIKKDGKDFGWVYGEYVKKI